MPTGKDHSSEIYLGEPSERSLAQAISLSVILPGLGHLYAGQLSRSMWLCSGWFLGLGIAIASILILDVFLFRTMMGLLVFWVIMLLWISIDLGQYCSRAGRTYILKPYNSGILYGILIVILGLLPIWGSSQYLTSQCFGIHVVSSDENFPSLRAGDRILYKKYPEKMFMPRRGTVVLAELRDGSHSALRVMAGPKDKIRVRANGRVLINQVLLQRQALGRVQWKNDARSAFPTDLVGFVEVLGRKNYEVFLNPEVRMYGESIEELQDDTFFLLADNRTTHRALDSRHLGPFQRSKILGEALYVLYAADPETGEIEWERAGLWIK